MIIFHEEVERVKTQNRRNIKYLDPNIAKNKDLTDPAVNAKQMSYGRNNAFESLAGSNPEEFDKEKLKAIKNSKNIVAEFDEYFNIVLGSQGDKLAKFFNNGFELNKYYELFNISVLKSLMTDFQNLVENFDLSAEDAAKAVYRDFVPEALSEAGVRKLIDIRLKNNQLLTDALIKMIKHNYKVFNLTETEAVSLIDDLNNDATNHEAIGKIKEFMQDPAKLNKFKMGKNNYDFRSIGGGCMFLSDTDNIKFSSHPSKNLDRIFKYDAIIIGHGSEDKDSSVHRAKDIADKNFVKKSLQNSLYSLSAITKTQQSAIDNGYFNNNDAKLVNESTEALRRFIKELESIIKQDVNYDDTDKLYKEIIRIMDNNIFYDKVLKDLNYAKSNIKKAQNWFKSKADPKTAMKDGGSANWTVEPINTLKRSGLNTIIDIIRQLKNEGFKNIYIGACNPGNITLPADIRNDKNFKVTCGSASVWLENEIDPEVYSSILEMEYNIDKMFDIYGREYENCSYNELCRISDELRQELYLTEGVSDVLRSIIKKAGQIIVSIWNKVIGVLKEVITKIYSFIRSKFDKNYKLKEPIKTTVINVKGGKPVATEVTITDSAEIEKISRESFNSIKNFINIQNQQEKQWMSKIERDIAAGKFSHHANGKIVDVKYRDVKESAIFRNIIFI